jgi:hypothetical protein
MLIVATIIKLDQARYSDPSSVTVNWKAIPLATRVDVTIAITSAIITAMPAAKIIVRTNVIPKTSLKTDASLSKIIGSIDSEFAMKTIATPSMFNAMLVVTEKIMVKATPDATPKMVLITTHMVKPKVTFPQLTAIFHNGCNKGCSKRCISGGRKTASKLP